MIPVIFNMSPRFGRTFLLSKKRCKIVIDKDNIQVQEDNKILYDIQYTIL